MKLAFYHGPRVGVWKAVSAFIRFVTGGPYCHVELIFSDGRAATSSFKAGGIELVRKTYDPAHWHVIDVAGDEYAAWQWFRDHEGAQFDTFGALAFLLRPFKGDESRWFCSEAVAAALGFPDPWRFDPNTLYAVLTRRAPARPWTGASPA